LRRGRRQAEAFAVSEVPIRVTGHGQVRVRRIADLHLWRLGPGHLGAIVSVVTAQGRGPDHYRHLLDGVGTLSHLTVEVRDEVHS
jgi:Co/Zn/Cd efflux system component